MSQRVWPRKRTTKEKRVRRELGRSKVLRDLAERLLGGYGQCLDFKTLQLVGISRLLAPTLPECAAMVADLVSFCGSQRELSRLTGFTTDTMDDWLRCRAGTEMVARRAVWFFWVLILHPGAIEDTIDIATWGRCPKTVSIDFPYGRANPAMAGRFKKVSEQVNAWKSKRWVEPASYFEDYSI